MRLTGFMILGLGALLVAFPGVCYLAYDVSAMERAGPVNAAWSGGAYWFALVPGTLALAVGAWLLCFRDKGYRETYDMREQQT